MTTGLSQRGEVQTFILLNQYDSSRLSTEALNR